MSIFRLSGWSPLPELPDYLWVWLAKSLGAIAGSAVSLVYVLPKGRREAASRFAVGAIAGLVFGTSVGHRFAREFELHETLSNLEISLVGATIASLTAWWVIGILNRLAKQFPGTS